MSIEQKRHSRLGGISLFLSLLVPAQVIAGLGLALLFNGGFPLPLGYALVHLALTALMLPPALLLGVIALLQKTARKDFALAGIIISAVSIFLLLLFIKSLFAGGVPGI